MLPICWSFGTNLFCFSFLLYFACNLSFMMFLLPYIIYSSILSTHCCCSCQTSSSPNVNPPLAPFAMNLVLSDFFKILENYLLVCAGNKMSYAILTGGGFVISPMNQGKQSVVKHMLAIDWKFWKSYLQPSCARSITIRMLERIAGVLKNPDNKSMSSSTCLV